MLRVNGWWTSIRDAQPTVTRILLELLGRRASGSRDQHARVARRLSMSSMEVARGARRSSMASMARSVVYIDPQHDSLEKSCSIHPNYLATTLTAGVYVIPYCPLVRLSLTDLSTRPNPSPPLYLGGRRLNKIIIMKRNFK